MTAKHYPGLDTSVFTDVIENGDAMARARLAVQLGSFLKADDTPTADREQILPVILKLCVDPVKDVRRALVAGLLDHAGLHADVVFSVIADEDDIALPFLAATPALNHWHMLAILRVGDEKRQQVLVMRSDLSAEALAFAVKSGPLDVCLTAFTNPVLQFTPEHYHTLYERFSQSAEMVELLLSRPELPLDLRIVQAKRAASRMRMLMAERGWVAMDDASELVEDAEETAILRILVEARQPELAKAIPFLVSKNMLTPSIIVRSAALGEMRIVQWALAHLSGVNLTRAHDMMFGRSFGGVKSLAAKSGLPATCLGILQAACDVVKDQQDEETQLDPESFGRRLIEALMTRYETMSPVDRTRNLELIGRYAEDKVRRIATRLRADMSRAA
jgi:uncharacterized protein (DUF2336 family)